MFVVPWNLATGGAEVLPLVNMTTRLESDALFFRIGEKIRVRNYPCCQILLLMSKKIVLIQDITVGQTIASDNITNIAHLLDLVKPTELSEADNVALQITSTTCKLVSCKDSGSFSRRKEAEGRQIHQEQALWECFDVEEAFDLRTNKLPDSSSCC